MTNDFVHCSDLNAVQRWALASILSEGEHTAPRSQDTLELYPVGFELENPRARCVTNRRRRWNLPLAIGEFAWHVSGSNNLDFIAYYTDRWREFSDDGSTIRGSCYGHRLFGGNPTRWSRMLQLLKADQNTRRAVFLFGDADMAFDLNAKDVACATSIQFLLRSNQLHAFVTMRSNDVIWGLPYDVFLFTMLQELLAAELTVSLGKYYHFAASFHLYKRHIDLAREIVSVRDDTSPPMAPIAATEHLPLFLRCEESLRSGTPLTQLADLPNLAPYWRSLLEPLESFRKDRYNDIPSSNPPGRTQG